MTAPSFTEHHIPQGQGNIYARDYAGAAPAFVLMHGFPDNLHIYDDLIPYLVAAGRQVVTFDFLGFGASDKPTGATYSFAQQIGDLRAVIEALKLGQIVPVGHDSSGMAAINFALDYPAQVASLCILNCIYAQTPTLRYPEFIELFANHNFKEFTQALMQSPEQFAWVLNFQRAQFARGLTDSQKAQDLIGPIIDQNFRQQPVGAGPAFAQLTFQFNDAVAHNTQRLFEVEALDIPARIIWGQRDPYLHPPLAEYLRAHLKRPDLHFLDAAHWLMLDAPAELAQTMLAP